MVPSSSARDASVKTEARYFISYTRLDESLPDRLLKRVQQHFAISRRYEFIPWRDTGILPGEDWDGEIQDAITECQVGLALLSPGYFSRPYIRDFEIPRLDASDKILIPVQLKPLDLARHDLQGLARLQHFRLGVGSSARAFSECGSEKLRDQFAADLYSAIEARLDKSVTVP